MNHGSALVTTGSSEDVRADDALVVKLTGRMCLKIRQCYDLR